jgi:RecA-family ATPase
MNSLSFALSYARIGWAVFPVWSCNMQGHCRCPKGKDCQSPGKHPHSLATHGHLDATTNTETIESWFELDPQAGVGVACERSGLVVLDIDPRNGGTKTLAKLESEHGPLISNCMASTQGGGVHRIFKAAPSGSYPSTLGPGLDVKHQGYICVEPTHGSNGFYKWCDGHKPVESLNLSHLPNWISNQALTSSGSRHIRAGSIIVDEGIYNDLASALNVIPPDIGYDNWLKVLYGLSRLHQLDKAKNIARNWSTRSVKPGHTLEAFNTKWSSVCKESSSTSYETTFYLADQHDRTWRDSLNLSIQKPFPISDPLAQKIRPFSMEELLAAQLYPRVLIKNYLYADLRNLIAAGGIGKTTMLIIEAICAALGRPIWGFEVPKPFRTVFVTKEDPREIFAGRLREAMAEMRLGESEKTQVLSMVYVVDLRGDSRKLAHVGPGGTITPDEKHLNALIEHILPIKPDRIIFDPLVSFTVGESHVNEAEQGVVEAARYIMRKIPNIAVDVVHHTGKANARNMAVDQYAGRNGSALPDGSRMVAVMIEPHRDAFLEETGVQLFPGDGRVGLRMAFPKTSYCRRPPDIYLIRDGFRFELLAQVTEAERLKLREDKKAAAEHDNFSTIKKSILTALEFAATSANPLDRYPSQSRVLDLHGVTGKNSSRKGALECLLRDGDLVELALEEEELVQFPDKRALGGRRTYIAIAEKDE